MRSALVFLAASTLLLGGCTRWVKAGATEYDFDVAKANCVAMASAAAPPNPVALQTGNGYQRPVDTSCYASGRSMNCTSTGGGYVPPAVTYYDQNNVARQANFDSCMYSRGWAKQR